MKFKLGSGGAVLAYRECFDGFKHVEVEGVWVKPGLVRVPGSGSCD